MAYPVYPVELREAPDGTVYLKMEHGAWAWAGKKTGSLWTHVNPHYELLLADKLYAPGQIREPFIRPLERA